MHADSQPVIRAITSDLLYTDRLIDDNSPYGGIVNDGPPTKYSALGRIRFENHGRTPAFPEKISVGWRVAERLPENPTYIITSNLNHAEVIKPENNFTTDTHYGIELTDEEIRNYERKSDLALVLWVPILHRFYEHKKRSPLLLEIRQS